MTTDMHIVAVGARTPVGLRAESSAAAVRAGICRVRYHRLGADTEGDPLRAALDSRLAPEVPGWRRMATLASSAIAEVAEKAASQLPASEKLDVLLSLPETRPGFSDADARRVAQAISQQATRASRRIGVELVGRGHAGALQAMRVAADRFAEGDGAPYVLCGTESYLDEETLEWLGEEDQLARKGNRSGFVPGEAAGALLLLSSTTVRRMRASSLARVRGIGIATETRRIKGDAECVGEGLAKAISAAAAPLRLPEQAIDAVFCDINGERYRAEELGLAMLRIQHAFKTTDYQLSCDCWGDVGAAAGALGCVLAVQTWRRRYSVGPRALVCAGSEGGLRGAVVLEQPGVP